MDAKTLGEMPATAGREEVGDGSYVTWRGLTICQEFAKAAMQGLLSNENRILPLDQYSEPEKIKQLTARVAIEFADALLAELAKDQP